MSFEATLTLKNRLDANVTFVRLFDDKQSSTYTRNDQPIGEPINMIIANTMAPAGMNGNDKILVKLTKTKVNAVTGRNEVGTLSCTLSVPRTWTNDEILDHIAALKAFLVEANFTRLRRGEI